MYRLMRIFLLLLVSNGLFAQIPVGTWRDHLPYRNATQVVQAGEKIFCSTPYALFSYDLDDNSLQKLSITNGLSDIGTGALNYFAEVNLLVVAYTNGNIDFIRGNSIKNLNYIKQKQIQGDKNIYQMIFHQNRIYLACGFGIVVLNPEKDEVEDTYYIGENASEIPVYSIGFDDNYIYATTDNAIYYADKQNPYLIDYNHWSKLSGLPYPEAKYKDIILFNGQLFINVYDEQNALSEVYKQESNGTWSLFYRSGSFIRRIKASEEELFIVEENSINIYDKSLLLKTTIDDYGFAKPSPQDIIRATDNKLYIADEGRALVINDDAGNYGAVSVSGPFTNHNLAIDARKDMVCIAGGGRTDYWGNLWNPPEAYIFRNEQWVWNILWDTDVRDFVCVLIDPYDIEHQFFGSWGGGVFEFQNNKVINTYNQTNSSLQAISTDPSDVRIGGLVLDEDNNLWVTNPYVPEPISVKTSSGDWYSLNYPEISEKITNKIINTQNNTKWVQIARGGGIFAFNDNYTPEDASDDEHRLFFAYDENGEFITKDIYDIAEDKDGVIWVGSDKGVLTYYNPGNVFSGENFYADRIKLVDVEQDSLVQYLLGREKVTAIAIDGANRKWFGTQNSGVYLMSEDARTEIFHFHTDNSPIFSNTVLDIAINEKSGEVFIGTPLGVISFKGTATEGDNTFSDAYVYPNPVRENYTGNITITGLAANVNVKITDISGRLVYETRAFGGQAIWNGKTFSGERVKTGVYLIFCTDDAGEYKKVLKLLFIN